MEVDYEKVGLKVGLEIHQQLDAKAKLFCDCKPELFKEEPEVRLLRRLRPTQSELGQVDPAAFFEFQKGVKILYEANTVSSCLVEMDEEPPHPLNRESVEIVLTLALMMDASPVDEIHVMRKTVIDGSNTTGFQRTCVVALGGHVDAGGRVIPIQHVSLEEDAARKMGVDEGNVIRYRIDRLGIPLVEIATAPVIHSPKEAGDVALAIGGLLRATGKVMRGLGTIRQDLNVSIPNGALIEIKGVQELDLISLAVEYEVQRQLNLIDIAVELKRRKVKPESILEEFSDVSKVLEETKSKVIRKALEKKQKVFAVQLPGFAGLLKRELLPNFRLGTEMSDRAKFWGRVGGIFHTDEMPAFGITSEEIANLRSFVKAEEGDAVVFVADSEENCGDALRAVVERAREAVVGVPDETRTANPDGTTHFMRPRPGAARMYPETDIPLMTIDADYINRVRLRLPELPEKRLERLMRDHKLNAKLAKQVLDSAYGDAFEGIVKDSGVSATVVAAFLTETLKGLRRDGLDVDRLLEEQVREVFRFVGSGTLVKESLSDVVVWLLKNEGKSVQDAVDALGLKGVSEGEVSDLVDKVIADNAKIVLERGEGSHGVLMGVVMRELRGKADAARVANLLREKLKRAVQ